MSYAPTNPRASGDDAERELPVADGAASADSPERPSAAEHPRLIEEHRVRSRRGEDRFEATDERGRRWYHLRPESRGRADLVGFNYTWWLMMWVLLMLIVFLPWGY